MRRSKAILRELAQRMERDRKPQREAMARIVGGATPAAGGADCHQASAHAPLYRVKNNPPGNGRAATAALTA